MTLSTIAVLAAGGCAASEPVRLMPTLYVRYWPQGFVGILAEDNRFLGGFLGRAGRVWRITSFTESPTKLGTYDYEAECDSPDTSRSMLGTLELHWLPDTVVGLEYRLSKSSDGVDMADFELAFPLASGLTLTVGDPEDFR